MRNHGIIDRKAERCCSLLENKGKSSIVGNSLLQRPKGNANRPQGVVHYAVTSMDQGYDATTSNTFQIHPFLLTHVETWDIAKSS